MAERVQSENLEGQEAKIPMDAETARRWLASLEELLDADLQADLDFKADLMRKELQAERSLKFKMLRFL